MLSTNLRRSLEIFLKHKNENNKIASFLKIYRIYYYTIYSQKWKHSYYKTTSTKINSKIREKKKAITRTRLQS